MKLGIEKTAMIRVRAGISFALTEAMDEGHCGLPMDDLMPLAEKLLEVPIDLVRRALDLEASEGTVVADSVGDTRCIFLAGLHRAERSLQNAWLKLPTSSFLGRALIRTRLCRGSRNGSGLLWPKAR